MDKLVLYFDCAMLILDLVTISDLREFLLDFLRVKKSRKNANRVYKMQTLREKITLAFIKEHLKEYIAEFTAYHKVYMAVLFTLIPQYIIIIVCNILLEMKSIFVIAFFAVAKLIISFVVRINTDSNRISIFRKK